MTTRADQAHAAGELGLRSATWRALGTSVQLVVEGDLDTARAAVERVLAEVDAAASRFRPDSELCRLAPGRWTEVSPLLARLLVVARDAAAWTDGLVDPTVGQTLSDLGYDRTFTNVRSDGPAVSVVRRPGGWRDLQVEGTSANVPVGLDLGATAKAVAADLCLAAVDGPALVGLGGDIASRGGPWPVLVTDIADPGLPPEDVDGQVIELTGALATSSTSARRWTRGGRVLHHVVDPRTALPADGPWRTVSVLSRTCALANVASTGAVVLGDDGPRWLGERHLSARLVAHDGTVRTVGAWP